MKFRALQRNRQQPWNKGRIVGQKPPLKRAEIWAIRARLQVDDNVRDLALFNLAIDSKLRGCDLVRLRVGDVTCAGKVLHRASVIQRKTRRPVQFEITKNTRRAISQLITDQRLAAVDFLFRSQIQTSPHLSTRQYAKLVKKWVSLIGLDPSAYGTHTMRRTKATVIYRQTKNLRAVQLLLGHSNLESTVRYLGIELEDALEIAEQTEV